MRLSIDIVMTAMLPFLGLLCSPAVEGLRVLDDLEVGVDLMAQNPNTQKLFMSLNPGCYDATCWLNSTSPVSVVNLTIVDSPAKHMEHHWIWSVIDAPAIQAALTYPGDVASIDWNELFSQGDIDSAIGYEGVPNYSATIMLSSLIEYDDAANQGFLNSTNPNVIVYPIHNFKWTRQLLENTTSRVAFGFFGGNYSSNASAKFNITGGLVNITISAYSSEGFGAWLPHLSHSENTNQFDIQLDKIRSNSGFNHSRFALEFIFVSDTEKRDEPYRQCTKTLDDEHTPGIFQTQELVIPGYNDSLQAFLQWRPVVYMTSSRELSASTDVNISHPVTLHAPNEALRQTILYAFYGEDLKDMLVKSVNVSLGASGDGFYNKTKYQAWTFTFGTGVPIHNGMSPLIILVMAIMFGVLMVIILISCVICAIKKFSRKEQGADIAYSRMDT